MSVLRAWASGDSARASMRAYAATTRGSTPLLAARPGLRKFGAD